MVVVDPMRTDPVASVPRANVPVVRVASDRKVALMALDIQKAETAVVPKVVVLAIVVPKVVDPAQVVLADGRARVDPALVARPALSA